MHACMHMQVCVFSYAGCFPGDKYAGSEGRYAYVGSYAGIASRDVYSMF